MLIKLITYSLLTICINFKDKGGNPPCSSPSMSDMIRENNNRLMFIARCCVQCLENNTVEEQQRKCLDYCKRNTSEKLVFKNIMSTESLKLLCRDDRRLVFSLQSRDSHPNGTIYIVKIMKYFMNSTDLVEIYMSNTSTFQLPSLYPGTKYNISIASLNLDLEYAIIANNEVFSTIRQNLKPKKIEKQNIHVISYQQDPTNMSHLSATITWKPSDDMCYYYELLWYSTSDTMALPKVFEVHDIREVYSHTLNSLELGTSYAIGIRTKMVSHTIRESNISWIEPIITPQCLSWHHNNTDVCAPYPPRDLHVREIEVDDVSTSLNVSWTVKLPEPHYYILELLSLSRYHSPPLRFNLTGNFSFYVIEIQKSNTTLYQIRLTAVNPGGSITVVSPQLHLETKIILHGKSVFIKMAIILLVAFSLIAITAVVLYRKPPIEQMKKYCGHEGLIMTDPIKDQKNFIEFTSYFDDLEISLDNIKIEEEELGAGAFGIVKRCIFKDKDCNFKHAAVKMLKLNPSVDEIKAFHREISMMKAVGKHQNIVSIIGHCTKTCDHLYLLTEYCAKGSLLDFLRNAKSGIMDKFTAFNANYMTPLQGYELLNIAKQVASGMQFLASSKIVHRDLAARNVLVCDDLTVKIADFGLSRDIYKDNIYKIVDRSKLPIKWYALESITYSFYTTQSDVWSFGILLYEIVTYGSEPYEGFIITNNFVNYLKEGNRMKRPSNCGLRLYNLMHSCWYENPDERPTFDLVVEILDDFLTRTPNEHILDEIIDVCGYMKPID